MCILKKLQSSLSGSNQSLESRLVVYSQICQHLTVDVNTSLLQTVHEGAVVHAVSLGSSGDTGDPQSAEISLLVLTADVCVTQGLHHCFVCSAEQLGLCTKVTLRKLQKLLSTLARHH